MALYLYEASESNNTAMPTRILLGAPDTVMPENCSWVPLAMVRVQCKPKEKEEEEEEQEEIPLLEPAHDEMQTHEIRPTAKRLRCMPFTIQERWRFQTGFLWRILNDADMREATVLVEHSEGVRFRVHRELLRAHSPVLSMLLERNQDCVLFDRASGSVEALCASLALMYLYESGAALERHEDVVARRVMLLHYHATINEADDTVANRAMVRHVLDLLSVLHFLQCGILFHLCHRILREWVEQERLARQSYRQLLALLSRQHESLLCPHLTVALWNRVLYDFVECRFDNETETETTPRGHLDESISTRHLTTKLLTQLIHVARNDHNSLRNSDRIYQRNMAHLMLQWYLTRHQFCRQRRHLLAEDMEQTNEEDMTDEHEDEDKQSVQTWRWQHQRDWTLLGRYVHGFLGGSVASAFVHLNHILQLILRPHIRRGYPVMTVYQERAYSCAFALMTCQNNEPPDDR